MLYGIDIASWQHSLVPSKMITTDFIIVKASGGKSYRNPYFKGHADATLKAGLLLGCYHFACENGIAVSAKQEADYFVAAVKDYIGKATLWLDYEMSALDHYDVAWCKQWLDRVKAETGCTPGIYMSKSVCRTKGWESVVKAGYPLWVAQYASHDTMGYKPNPWTDDYGYGAWSKPTIFQYTSSGGIKGYPSELDLDIFYGTEADWNALAGKASTPTQQATKTVSRANVAAQIMEHLVTCPEHGYSQKHREGTSGYCEVKTDVGTVKVKKGDRDCSSAVCEAWQLAIKGTPYEGKLDAASWTGNIESVFLASGLFDKWNTATTEAVRGDVYLVHNSSRQHTAMCVDGGHDGVHGYDALAEFSIAETGGIDGKTGDQTGWESAVNPFYDAFTVTLHYNGKADTTASAAPQTAPAAQQQPTTAQKATKPKAGKFKVLVNNLNVRSKPSTTSTSVAKYQKGQTLVADKVYDKGGYYWASYIGSSSGKRRYVAIMKNDGSKKYMKRV